VTASCYILEDGVLYRGQSRPWPVERWSRRQRRFLPYRGKTPKDITWGKIIGEAEAREIMGDAPVEDAESGDAPRFLLVLAKHSFVLRVSPGAPAEFFNRKTLRWHPWPGPIPAPAWPISKADVWRTIYQDTKRLDFGTLDRPYREWPAPVG
jgi:hypothetical protein